jgi:hypothetical protein
MISLQFLEQHVDSSICNDLIVSSFHNRFEKRFYNVVEEDNGVSFV